MAQNFYDFRQDIIDWSNRDNGVLTPAVLRDCMNFAADTCYRELEVPPLEATVTYQLSSNGFQPRYPITRAAFTMDPGNFTTIERSALDADSIRTVDENSPDEYETGTFTFPSGELGVARTVTDTNDMEIFVFGNQVPPIVPISAYVVVDNQQAQVRVSRLPIPTDATSFIHLRTRTSNGVEYTINEKVDTRTFWDTDSIKTSNTYWSRQGNTILVGGFDVSAGTVLELHYYRRLPAVDARYAITPANFTANRLTPITPPITPFTATDNDTFNGDGTVTAFTLTPPNATLGRTTQVAAVTVGDTLTTDYTLNGNTLTFGTAPAIGTDNIVVTYNQQVTTAGTYTLPVIFATLPTNAVAVDTLTIGTVTGQTGLFLGQEVPNWLRDENRKSLLFGSLYHVFDYLADAELTQRYQQKFAEAIGELNEEEKLRDYSGANVSVNYTSYLL